MQIKRKHSLHHAAAVGRQSVVGVADVSHVHGAPEPLSHCAGPRPAVGRAGLVCVSCSPGRWGLVRGRVRYQSLGVRLVASTNSPQRQASPPITSFFCSAVPVSPGHKSQS